MRRLKMFIEMLFEKALGLNSFIVPARASRMFVLVEKYL